MKIFVVGLLILLTGYHSIINKRCAITDRHKRVRSVDTSSKIKIVYPIHVEYTQDANADTMFFYIGDDRLLITPKGYVTKKNEPVFEIHPEGNLQKLFPFMIDDDIVIIYSYSTLDGESGGFAKRISLKHKSVVWETSIYGFNLMQPVLNDGYVYLSTIGFVGKLNVTSGKFIWEFNDFFKNGIFISFNEPVFYKDGTVLFTEKNSPKSSGCSILIDDKKSRVLKIEK